MRFEGAIPSEDEIAAIAAAIAVYRDGAAPPEPTKGAPSPWAMAMRLPDLDIDDLRNRTCLPRF